MTIPQELIWWITVIDLPALAGLLALIWRTRIEGQRGINDMRHTLDQRSEQLRDALGSFKLEVARNYAQHSDLKDLEKRIVSHLLRIESKLDATALKAEALGARE